MGYLKKCGDISISGVNKAQQKANLKTGVVGIQVSIMPGTTILPDKIKLLDEPTTIVEEVKEETDAVKEIKEKIDESKPKKKTAKKVTKKKTAKIKEAKE